VPGLTDESKPRLRGPKRASKIRKLFNLTKEDDVRKYVNVFRKVRNADVPLNVVTLHELREAGLVSCRCALASRQAP